MWFRSSVERVLSESGKKSRESIIERSQTQHVRSHFIILFSSDWGMQNMRSLNLQLPLPGLTKMGIVSWIRRSRNK